MFDIGHKDGPRPRCFFTHSILPAFVDHDQPSRKKKPFSTMQEHPFVQTLDLLLPKELQDDFFSSLNGQSTLHYTKVYMNLREFIEGDFFNEYIKTGNIIMLSSGRPGLDNTFTLHEGILRLELDKATYERTGLKGTSVPTEGRKHVKARYAVEINLRLPSMVRGKHGFERILWAFKNVLSQRMTWLFYDAKGANDGTGPIAAHSPILMKSDPEIEEIGDVPVPDLPDEFDVNDQDTPIELLEWLSLAMSGSPRVRTGDQIDPYLSRYKVPGTDDEASATTNTKKLCRIRWHGLISYSFVETVTIAAMKNDGPTWFAIRTRAFDSNTHTFLQRDQQTCTWEFTT